MIQYDHAEAGQDGGDLKMAAHNHHGLARFIAEK
jgi:hypothetical protein